MATLSPRSTRWRVAIPLPIPAYDFLPAHNTSQSALGKRVLVPWQGGTRIGLVIEEVHDQHQDRNLHLKEAIAVLDEDPVLEPDGCAALLEIAQSCFCSAGIAYQDFVPWGLEPAHEHLARLVPGINLEPLPTQAARLVDWTSAPLHDPGLLEFLRGQGLLEEEASLLRPTREVLRLVESAQKTELTKKQAQALEVLSELRQFDSATAWAEAAGVGVGVVTKLVALGYAERVRVAHLTPPPDLPAFERPLRPRPEDTAVFEQLERLSASTPAGSPLRLHGGKPKDRFAVLTELIRRCHGSVLYLAPDYSRLERAFKTLGGLRPSAVLSGDLKYAQREAVWRSAARGEVELLFGTPFSLLVPLQNLEWIIVEDELSDAWKLLAGSRAFVAQTAQIRARHSGARLLYCGTVPAAESLSSPGVVLPAPRARLHVVDLNEQPSAPETGPLSNFQPPRDSFPLSTTLKRLLRQTAERGRQAVVIAPRRGYSALIRCKDCGWLPFCPNCDVPLRYHLETRRLECHQCGHTERPPTRCPNCEGTLLSPRGPGSQWIQRELEKLLPGTRVYRFDRDKRDDLERLYRGEPGVIVGTTAVLGLPAPPDLALIALTFADTMHTNPDFRASERYHFTLRQLLEWHPTRAPLTLVQTFQASHAALKSIQALETADAYPSTVLPDREAFHYPPFTQLAQVQVAARRQGDAEIAASKLGALIRDRGAAGLELLGPAPAPIARLKGLFAFQLLVRAPTLERLAQLLEPARNFREGGVRTRVEMNPRQLDDLLE